jgi:hypothetical protein
VTFRDALVLFGGGAALGTLLIGVITVYQWLDPWQPVMIAVAMGGVLSAAIAFAYVNRDQPSAFIRGFLLWTLISAPTVAWGFAPVRAAALDLMGGQLTEQAQFNVLDDSATEVLQSACTALTAGNSTTIKSLLAERLAASPEMGTACVEALAAQDDMQAASMSSSFLRQWETALAAHDAPKVCQTAPHLFEMSKTQPNKPVLPLTRCAVGEATSDAKVAMAECCADALVAQFDSASAYVDALGPTGEIDDRIVPTLFATMTPYAFRNINASRHPLPELQSELMRKPPTQAWLTDLACYGLLSSHTPSEYFGGLEAIAETQSCNMSIGDKRGARQWQQVCRQWMMAPDEGLCPPIHAQAEAQAVSAAQVQVHKAIVALYNSELGRQIIAGAAYMSRGDGTVDGFSRQFADAYDPMNLPQGQGNAQFRHAARKFHGNSAAYLKALREHGEGLSKANPANSKKVAQDLLKKGLKPKMSWSELKPRLSPEQQAEGQAKVDALKKQLEQSDTPDDSPIYDLVR